MICAEKSRRALQGSLSQISCQSSVSIFPSGLSESQLWQGTTFPPGVMAILERQAPQDGEGMFNSSNTDSSSHPGDVKAISISFW